MKTVTADAKSRVPLPKAHKGDKFQVLLEPDRYILVRVLPPEPVKAAGKLRRKGPCKVFTGKIPSVDLVGAVRAARDYP